MAFRHKNQVQLSSHFWELASKEFSAMECSVCRVAISKPYQESFLLWAANYLFQGGQDSPRGAKNFFREMFVEIRPFKQILYCDTLAWKPPSDIIDVVNSYISHIPRIGKFDDTHLFLAHHPMATSRFGHMCDWRCCNYPLQTCSEVCGVIVLIIAALAALDRPLFQFSIGPSEKIQVYSTTSKPPCLFSKENHNVLVCRKSHWNQLCASASWLAR